jgi:hypothetical protein
MFENVFYQIGAILCLAAAGGAFALLLRQPLIVAFIATLLLDRVLWVVSTLRERTLNRALLQGLKQQGYHGKVAVSSSTRREADSFVSEGVDLVLVPYADAAKEAADKLLRECRQHTDTHNFGVGG